MALPSLAPVSALERRLGIPEGSLAGLDLARAEDALADVSALVRAEALGRTWVDVDGVTITAPAEVVTVVVMAAKRTYENPSGYSSESMGGAYAYGLTPENASGPYLTDRESRIVKRAAAANGAGGVYTLRTPSAYFDPGVSPMGDLLP